MTITKLAPNQIIEVMVFRNICFVEFIWSSIKQLFSTNGELGQDVKVNITKGTPFSRKDRDGSKYI